MSSGGDRPVDDRPVRRAFALTGTGRVVYRMQWWAPVVLTLWVLIGRVFVGSPLGWIALVGFFTLGPVLLVLLYLPALTTLADDEVRRSRTARLGYSIAMYCLWAVVFVGGLVMPDAGDGGPTGSALTAWTGGAVTPDLSVTLVTVAAWVAGPILVTAIGLGLAGSAR
jgi:hypothetical protein